MFVCNNSILTGYSLLDLNCTADCLTSSKTVSAMWRLPAQVTCQHTCQANIACSNGYKETRKVRFKLPKCVTEFDKPGFHTYGNFRVQKQTSHQLLFCSIIYHWVLISCDEYVLFLVGYFCVSSNQDSR